jgi:hypothetical protein
MTDCSRSAKRSGAAPFNSTGRQDNRNINAIPWELISRRGRPGVGIVTLTCRADRPGIVVRIVPYVTDKSMSERDTLEPSGMRAELLCFLVATAAASYSLTQEWRVDHVVQCCRTWLARHGVSMHWLERVRIGQLALTIARRDLRDAGIAVRLSNVQALFTDDMALNYSSTMVQKMLALCKEAL